MTETRKKGSSRRKGDEYQDLTALRIALEKYIARTPFEMYLEYEKAGNLDDIVLFQDNKIVAYQVKYAVNPHDVYKTDDFIDTNSPVCFKKFANSWKTLRERFPEHNLTVCLCTNRALDPALVDLITQNGEFKPEVIENRRRGEARKLRLDLASASGLDEDSFKEFLRDFRFLVRQPTLAELEQNIQIFLLDRELGLSDSTIFLDLKEAIKQNAIFSREAITDKSINKILERLQSKLLIPQVFPVNRDHFVELKSFSEQLDRVLPQLDGKYLIVTGLPGSGKSTSLTTYFDSLDRNKYEVVKYYCFTGVNDNAQKIRVQTESLRANLLDEFHRRYPNVLKRRFDYSEPNFLKCLKTLAEFFVEQDRRLIVFLDGLDHAERLEPEVRDTVISALPPDVPKGVTIVVGTQELHKWPYFLRRAREAPETHIQMPLFSVDETQDYLKNKRGISGLSRAEIIEIHRKCEGLPLYLRYAAEILLSSDAVSDAISYLAPAQGGDIRNYYDLLWDEFERVGMADARHLCAVMACLRFPVHRDELYSIQNSLNRPQFEDAYKCMTHLLRDFDNKLSVFHNSFREFVISQLPGDWLRDIKANIVAFLKDNKDSFRWFRHVFEYCYEVGDYKYILEEVNADFVERALLHCRPSKEIMDALNLAIESAFKQEDIVHLGRLGVLKYRTKERLDYNLNRTLLADALLALGREQDVISFAYSSNADRWIVDDHISLAIMSALAENGKLELGHNLFDVFTNNFKGIHSDSRSDVRSQVVGIARCLGIYEKRQARPLRWLSYFEFEPDILEQKDTFAPFYAPHLESYIDALVQFGHTDKWMRLKHVKVLFPNRLVRYLLIRSLARHNLLNELKTEIIEFLEQEQPKGNLELAFYAAKAGMPVSIVSTIAGTIEAPKIYSPDYLSRSDPILKHYAYSFVILGYEGSKASYDSLCEIIGTPSSLWKSSLLHILKSCYCIGQSLAGVYDWFSLACESVDILVKAEQGDGERIFESIDLIRDVLRFTIGLLTEEIQKRFPNQLDAWVEKLASLRDSLLWTTHFGISESIQDYTFELFLWELLAKNPMMRSRLTLILRNCVETYKKSTLLKGWSRSEHFMRLSAIMAKCGMRNEAEKWLHYGIRASLIYGYHKDITLLHLIDVLHLVNRHQLEKALERCARVLEMVKWMPHLTDGRETKYFPKEAFKEVLNVNRSAAFELVMHFSKTIARWQMQDCLEEYLLSADNGDMEYLWCLTELFSNQYSDDGRYCKQIMGTREHIVDLVHKSHPEEVQREFANRFRHFVLTEITPRHWPNHLKAEFSIPIVQEDSQKSVNTKSSDRSPSEFMLDGKSLNRKRIAEKFRKSFSEFLVTFKKLKEQNDSFFERDLIDECLRYHIAKAHSLKDLLPIKEYVKSQGRWQNPSVIETLAKRFMDFGDQVNAVECYKLAYHCHYDWFPWRNNSKYLAAIAEKNIRDAKYCLLKECYESAIRSEGGYDTPAIAAAGLDALNETGLLETVFEDFLAHCESMFAQLPKDNDYDWLKEYLELSVDENERILQFLINELETPEIDHGERLVRALVKLAIARSESVIPRLVNNTLSSTGRTFRRLLIILYTLAAEDPSLLVSHQQKLTKLLDREDFFCRQIIMCTLRYINEASPLNSSVAIAVQRIERKYSASISYSTYRMPLSPSFEFLNFLRQNTLFEFYDKVELIEKILEVPSGSLVAAIEKRLKTQNWSIDEERFRIKDDWYEHVHPQGWPVVWITTEFQELVTGVLWNTLNEAAEKMKLSPDQIHWIWQTIQPSDPEYLIRGIIPRPVDIEPLRVTDKDRWFKELDALESLQIGKPTSSEHGAEWITVFERRLLSYEEQYNIPFKQKISLTPILVPPQVYGNARELNKLDLRTERMVPASEIAVTLEQARNILMSRGSDILNKNTDCIPLIALHQNPVSFLGYWIVCTCASFIINEFSLSFDGFNLTRKDEVVAQYEVWQEGYQDEAYTREKLSYGVRFRLRRDFLTDICRQYNKILCIHIDESREYYKSIHDREPDDIRNNRHYIIYHLL